MSNRQSLLQLVAAGLVVTGLGLATSAAQGGAQSAPKPAANTTTPTSMVVYKSPT